jgi:hypothetical protein
MVESFREGGVAVVCPGTDVEGSKLLGHSILRRGLGAEPGSGDLSTLLGVGVDTDVDRESP